MDLLHDVRPVPIQEVVHEQISAKPDPVQGRKARSVRDAPQRKERVIQREATGLQLEKRVSAPTAIGEQGLRHGGNSFHHGVPVEDGLRFLHGGAEEALTNRKDAPVELEIDEVGELVDKEQPQVAGSIQADQRLRGRRDIQDDVRRRCGRVPVCRIHRPLHHHP